MTVTVQELNALRTQCVSMLQQIDVLIVRATNDELVPDEDDGEVLLTMGQPDGD